MQNFAMQESLKAIAVGARLCAVGADVFGFAAVRMAREFGVGIASPELPMKFGSRIVRLYAMSDTISTIATVKIDKLLHMPRHSSG